MRRFQQENGIDTDGIAGPITLGVLSQKAGTGSASEEAATPDRREETNISPVSSNTSINDWANSANLSSGASGFGLIQYGDISGDVYMVQNLLKQLGYDVPVDGYCYESTIEAIKQFQKVNGLTADGIFGPATAYRLENSPLPNNTTDTGWVTDTISSHVDSIIAAATNDSMTQDEKLRAVFNYIADRGNYAYSLDRIPPYTAADWPVVYANDMITNKSGDCHGTAALFGYAARKLGYDAYWCNTDGGHGWVEINGKIYDPLYQNASSHPADVYDWTYEQASSAGLDAGYRRLSGQAKTYRYIQVPTTK